MPYFWTGATLNLVTYFFSEKSLNISLTCTPPSFSYLETFTY